MKRFKRQILFLGGLIALTFYSLIIIRLRNGQNTWLPTNSDEYLRHRFSADGFDNYTQYTVQRLGLVSLKDQRPLRTDMGDPINDVTSFRYGINGEQLCQEKMPTQVLVIIVSAPGNFDKRDLLRNTWLTHILPSGEISYAFFIGLARDKDTQKKIVQEHKLFHDIIQLDMQDTYNSLAIKTVALLHWTANYCSQVPFILKCDDDVYVSVDNLLSSIRNFLPSSQVIYGSRIVLDNLPQRSPEHKHYISFEVWPWPTFPPYVYGGCYLMSQEAVGPLLAAAQTTPHFPFEDLYLIGLCARKARVQLFSHDRMFVPWIKNDDQLDACFVRDTITWQTFSDVQMYDSHMAIESYREGITECLSSDQQDRFLFQPISTS